MDTTCSLLHSHRSVSVRCINLVKPRKSKSHTAIITFCYWNCCSFLLLDLRKESSWVGDVERERVYFGSRVRPPVATSLPDELVRMTRQCFKVHRCGVKKMLTINFCDEWKERRFLFPRHHPLRLAIGHHAIPRVFHSKRESTSGKKGNRRNWGKYIEPSKQTMNQQTIWLMLTGGLRTRFSNKLKENSYRLNSTEWGIQYKINVDDLFIFQECECRVFDHHQSLLGGEQTSGFGSPFSATWER